MIAVRIAARPDRELETRPQVRAVQVGTRWAYAAATEGSELIEAPDRLVLRDREEPRATVSVTPTAVALLSPAAAGRHLLVAIGNGDLFAGGDARALAALGMPLREDPDALAEHLAYGSVTPPRTPFEGVKRCAPSSETVFRPDHGGWQSAETALRLPPRQETLAALAKPIDHLPRDAVALLSGGLDSTLLTALMARRGTPVASYSSGYWFDREEDIERRYAESAARELRTKHRHVVPPATIFLDSVVHSIDAAGEPLPFIQCALLDAALRQLALAPGTVLVNGQGADALFPPAFAQAGEIDSLPGLLAAPDAPSATFAAQILDVGAERLLAPRLALAEQIAAAAQSPYEAVRRYLFIVGMVGARHSWAASAERLGLRMAYPFLDSAVLAAAAAVPVEEAGREPKGALRQAARALGIGEGVIVRPKRAFGPATQTWARSLEPLLEVACEGALREAAQRLCAVPEGRYVFWNLVNQGLWRRLVFESTTAADLIGEIRLRP